MTDVIFPHSYTNTSCLQVFLYTNVDRLFKEAALALSEATHQEPLFAIVPGYEQKEALLNQYYKQNGFTNFVEIGTFPEIIKSILQKYHGYKNPQIHDLLSLTFAIYELILQKNEAVNFIEISAGLLEDLNAVFSLAKDIAEEFFQFLDVDPNPTDLKPLFLKQAIKKLYPDIFFLEEAFVLCKNFYDKFIFIGFNILPFIYINELTNTKAKVFFITPSLAFLGDILSPKQRLKNLRFKQQQIDHSFSFKEHPFLEILSHNQKAFYNKIAELEHVYLDNHEYKQETTLKKIQADLRSGFFEKKQVCDDSFEFFETGGVYNQCLLVFSYLEKLFKEDQELKHNEISVVADPKYGPILNAIGKTYAYPIVFSSVFEDEEIWDFIKFVFSAEEVSQNQNYFIQFCHKLSDLFYLYKVPINESLKVLLQLCRASHLAIATSNKSGLEFLKSLKQSFLKAIFFDLDENEIGYEINFLDLKESNDVKSVLELLEEVESLFLFNYQLKDKHLDIKGWFLEIKRLFENPIFSKLPLFPFQKKLMQNYKKYEFIYNVITIENFFSILGCLKKEATFREEEIKIYNSSSTITKSYRYIIYLSPLVEAKKGSDYFGSKNDWNHLNLLALNQALEKVLIIDDNYQSKPSQSPSNSFVDIVKNQIIELKNEGYNHNNIVIEINKQKEFINENLISSLHIDDYSLFYSLDIQDAMKFITETESFIKKRYLFIKEDNSLVDQDVFERNLLKWLLRRKTRTFLDQNLDAFYKFDPLTEKELFLRTSLSLNDNLTSFLITKPYELELKKDLTINFYGLSDEKIENKLSSKALQMLNFLNIYHFFKGHDEK